METIFVICEPHHCWGKFIIYPRADRKGKNTGFEVKTLWDWMDLLIIPLFLAGGAFFLNSSEKETERQRAEDRAKLEREIATDRQQETALQAYLDRMAELLMKENLQTTKKKSVRNVARIRTLTVLRGLDARRKGYVAQFLYEAHLISSSKQVVSLESADLRDVNLFGEELRSVSLDGADLRNANLGYTKLDHAVLRALLNNANLLGASLQGANLQAAFLNDANLELANLEDADLTMAVLYRADFTKANLTGAIVSTQQLAQAKSLAGATMPDGTKHE